MGFDGSGWGGGLGEAAAQGQRDVDQGDEDRDLDERADDTGKGLAGGGAVGGDRDGDGQFEVVAGGGERQRGGACIDGMRVWAGASLTCDRGFTGEGGPGR